MNKLKSRFLTVAIVVALAVAGCRSKTTLPTGYPINNSSGGGGYPANTLVPPATPPSSGYPGGASASPTTNSEVASFIFTLDPIRAGDTHVTGAGPASLLIRLTDYNEAGFQIGTGLIDAQGHFDIAINPPAIGGHRINLQLGDLTGTKYHLEDFGNVPGIRDIPLIGLVMTSTLTIK
jgi:hypothetical protein